MAGSFENPQQIIRSWGLQGSFASGAVVQDKLVPARFTRIRTPFLQTWREEALNSSLDWGVQNFSYYLPESLRVISSMFLKIVLPAISGTNYKAPRTLRSEDDSLPKRRAGGLPLRRCAVPPGLPGEFE